MTPIIFAIITAIGWATGDIFGGLVARKIGGYSSAILWITRNSGYLENRGYTAFHANTQRSF